jgi:putative oxidoreductase
MGLARLLLRTVVGGLFIGHGTQKLFGWFGGGALLALGLATPVAEATLIAVMLTAISTVHGKNGPWATNGGYEYNLILISALLGLAETGPGRWSFDHDLGIECSGLVCMAATLAAGVAGSRASINAAQSTSAGAVAPEAA